MYIAQPMLFVLQGEFSHRISPSCLPSRPRLASSLSCCPCTTSRASSSWVSRWAVVPSSCMRTSMVSLPQRSTPSSAPSTSQTASKWATDSLEEYGREGDGNTWGNGCWRRAFYCCLQFCSKSLGSEKIENSTWNDPIYKLLPHFRWCGLVNFWPQVDNGRSHQMGPEKRIV